MSPRTIYAVTAGATIAGVLAVRHLVRYLIYESQPRRARLVYRGPEGYRLTYLPKR